MSQKQHSNELFLAEYTLGVLDSDQLAQAHALLGSDDSAVACALKWEERFLDLTDSLTPLHASDQLLHRIQATLDLPKDASRVSATLTPSPQAPTSAPDPVPTQKPAVSTAQATSHPRSAFPTSADAQTAATPDFEPRLLRPDASSTRAQQSDQTRESAPTSETKTPEATTRSRGTKGTQRPARGDGPRIEPTLDAPSPSQPADAAVRPQSKPDDTSEQPARVRKAPPDPLDAFRPDPTRRRRGHAIWRNVWFWRALSGALAILAIVLALPEHTFSRDPAQNATLQPAAAPARKIVQVAIMQAPGTSSTPGWVLTVDNRQNVVLAPQVDIVVPNSDSVYLWTYNEQSPHPRLLGMVDPTQPLTLPHEVTGEVAPGQIFEMTQESTLNAPREPEGPILFIGRTVRIG